MTADDETAAYLESLRADGDRARAEAYETATRAAMGERLWNESKAPLLNHAGNRAALSALQEWLAASTLPSLILTGPVGAGKTFTAAHLLHQLTAAGVPVLWVSLPLLVAEVQAGFSDDAARRRSDSTMRAAARADVLVLDDLGKVFARETAGWAEEWHWRLIDPRYSAGLPTVVTTEWTGAGLDRRVGAAVRSRLESGAWVLGLTPPAGGGWRKPARVVRPD